MSRYQKSAPVPESAPLAKGDTVYLSDGTKCEYGGPIYGGQHLVYVLSRLHEDAESDIHAAPTFVHEVFPEPPIVEKDKRVQELDQAISDKITRLLRIQDDLQKAERQKSEMARQIARHEGLQHVVDFLEGRIKYVVTKSGSDYDIKPLQEMLEKTDSFYNSSGLRLLSLYGNLKTELSWGVSSYSDGSGITTTVWPFYTVEDARDFLVQHIEKVVEADLLKLNIHWLAVYEKTYERLNKTYGFSLKLPEAATAAITATKKKALLGKKEKLEKEYQEIQQSLSSLEPPE